ncbi:MAG: TetR/AcrR family transcriptional regulator [Oscillospiraceae bacterium]|nr:TetR/AcrR family transcriptional regulator [Oscillospiraceae bacterium]
MPKVDKGHFEEKANKIVDAAIRVCKTKPAYAVTLRDVVKESGVSQGGMYCYFSSIDEIFAEILNRAYSEFQLGDAIDEVFQSNKPLHEVIIDAFALLGQLADGMVAQYGKLLYEISDIYANEPERVVKIIDRIRVTNDTNAVVGRIMTLIEANIASGTFNPMMPKEHILLLIGVMIQGITKTVTFSQNAEMLKAQTGVTEEYTTAQGMMKVLAQTILRLIETDNSEEK